MAGLLVSDLMTRHVEFLDPDATVQDAAVMMGDLDVGGLPIGSDAAIEGVITDRDILYRVVAAGLDPSVTVRRVMSESVIACNEADRVEMVLDTMAAHSIRRMPVQDEKGAIVGWITLGDLSRNLLIESGTLQDALRRMTETDAAP